MKPGRLCRRSVSAIRVACQRNGAGTVRARAYTAAVLDRETAQSVGGSRPNGPSAWTPQRASWSWRGVLGGWGLLCAILIALQVFQARSFRKGSPYIASYWHVDYSVGFVRRGMAGALLDLAGATPAHQQVAVLLTGVLPTLAAVVLVIALLGRRGWSTTALAVLLSASPWAFDEWLTFLRPDQFATVVLIAVALLMVRRRLPWVGLAACGAAFAFVTLMHEGAWLYNATFAVPLVLLARSEPVRPRLGAALLVAGPGFVTLVVSTVFGAVGPEAAQALIDRATSLGLASGPLGPRTSTLVWLPGGLQQAVSAVGATPIGLYRSALVLGAILLGLQVAWFMLARIRHGLARRPQPAWLVVAVLVFLAVAVGVTYATGFDWQRWNAVFGVAALVVVAGWLLGSPPVPRDVRPGNLVTAVLVVVACWLALAGPIAELGPVGLEVSWWGSGLVWLRGLVG